MHLFIRSPRSVSVIKTSKSHNNDDSDKSNNSDSKKACLYSLEYDYQESAIPLTIRIPLSTSEKKEDSADQKEYQ